MKGLYGWEANRGGRFLQAALIEIESPHFVSFRNFNSRSRLRIKEGISIHMGMMSHMTG